MNKEPRDPIKPSFVNNDLLFKQNLEEVVEAERQASLQKPEGIECIDPDDLEGHIILSNN